MAATTGEGKVISVVVESSADYGSYKLKKSPTASAAGDSTCKLEVMIRVLMFMASTSAALLLATSLNDGDLYTVNFIGDNQLYGTNTSTFGFKNVPQFVYFVAVNSIVAGYLLISFLVYCTSITNHGFSSAVLIPFDALIVAGLGSASGVIAFMNLQTYVADSSSVRLDRGSPMFVFSPDSVCSIYQSCQQILSAMVLCFGATILGLVLISTNSCTLYRQILKH